MPGNPCQDSVVLLPSCSPKRLFTTSLLSGKLQIPFLHLHLLLILCMWPYFLFHWGSKRSEECFIKFPPPHLPTRLPSLPSLPYLWTINEDTYLPSAPPVLQKPGLPYISPASAAFCSHEITFSISTESLSSVYKYPPISPILKLYPFGPQFPFCVLPFFCPLKECLHPSSPIFSGTHCSQALILTFPETALDHITRAKSPCPIFGPHLTWSISSISYYLLPMKHCKWPPSSCVCCRWVYFLLSSQGFYFVFSRSPPMLLSFFRVKTRILTMAHNVSSGPAPFPPCPHLLILSFLCLLCSSFRASSPLLLIRATPVPTSEILSL